MPLAHSNATSQLLLSLARAPGLKAKPDQGGGATIFPEVYYPLK